MKALVVEALRQIEASAARGIWEAHRGCAAVAGALLLAQDLVGRDARPMVEAQVRSLLGLGHGETVATESMSRTAFVERLLREVAIGAGEPKEIGHDVIYSAYVLRALEVFAIAPWPSLLAGVTTLVRQVKCSGPGWITVNGRNERHVPTRPAADLDSGWWMTFAQFDRPLPMEAGDMQLGHLLTHGHAIGILGGFGGQALMDDLELAFAKRVSCLRDANQEERSRVPLRHVPVDPRAPRYWQLMEKLGDMHGHVFKYAYSFLDTKGGQVSDHDLELHGRIMWPAEPASVIG